MNVPLLPIEQKQQVAWKHLMICMLEIIVHKDKSGLSLVPKFNIHLTSFSRMCVDLAVQVIMV